MRIRLFLDSLAAPAVPGATDVIAVVVPDSQPRRYQLHHAAAGEPPAELTREPLEAHAVAVALVSFAAAGGSPMERIDRGRHLLERAFAGGGAAPARVAAAVAEAVDHLVAPISTIAVHRSPAVLLPAAPGAYESGLRVELAEDLDTWRPANAWAEIEVGALGVTPDGDLGEVVAVDAGRRTGTLEVAGEPVEFTRLAEVRFPPAEAASDQGEKDAADAAEEAEEVFAPPAESEAEAEGDTEAGDEEPEPEA